MRAQRIYLRTSPKASIDWVTGTEKRTRVDFKAYPRNAEDVGTAEDKTKLLKYLSDVNKTGFARSRAFSDVVKVGIGWLEDGIRDDPTEEPLFSRSEDWRNMWYDHLSREPDQSDARYNFRSKWVDLDISVAMFPRRESELRAASQAHNIYRDEDDEFYWLQNTTTSDGRKIERSALIDDAFNVGNRRDRVRLIECWYRVPTSVKILRGFPELTGTVYDPSNPRHVHVVQAGQASLYDSLKMLVRCAIFVSGTISGSGFLLQDMPSPYRHNRFPFTPIWCYRRGRDKAPYGMVRNLRDPQEDLNKRRSKALFILSANRMIADEDAFEDWDEAAEELARPDGILKKKKGSEVKLENDTDLAEEHVMLAKEDAKYIQNVSGVTDDNMGRETNATSGIALQARTDQGTIVTADIFDNYRLAFQLQGEIQTSLIEQFYDQAKTFRIIGGGRNKIEFVKINQVGPDGSVLNPITASKADFIVDAQDFRESVRMAMFESLLTLCGQLAPEVSIQLLDLVVELSDIPGKEEMVRRIRKINGQQDPDQPDSPEAQAQAQAAQQQTDLQNRAIQAQLSEAEAKVKKLLAEAMLLIEKAKSEQVSRSVEVAQQSTAHVMARAQLADQEHRRTLDTFKAHNDLVDSAHRRTLDTFQTRANIEDQHHRQTVAAVQAKAGLQDQFHRQNIAEAQHELNLKDQEHRHEQEKTQTEATIQDQTERRKIEQYKAQHPPVKAAGGGAKKPGSKKTAKNK